MLKTILFLILFAIFDQECASGNLLKPISLEQAYSLSCNLFIPPELNNSDNLNNVNVNELIDLNKVKAFDFWYKITENKTSHCEGVIQLDDNSIKYITSDYGWIKVSDFRNTILIDSKLRNGIFYLGNKRSLMQNEGGDIVYDASIDEHPKKLTLFQKFEKISLCLIRDDYIVLVKRDLSKGPNIVYNQVTNTKHVETSSYECDDYDKKYPLLQHYYYKKYPWRNSNFQLNNDSDIKINQAGDLVLWQSTFSCWISACRKIKFNKIIMFPNTKKSPILHLENSDDPNVYYTFNVKENKFYSIPRTPEYDENHINEWFYADIPSFQPLKQSLIGYYFGAYLVALKAWFDRCKSYFLHKDEII